MPWIDRLQQEPPTTDAPRIVVWHEGSDMTDVGVVTAMWLPSLWVDASNAEEVNFRYWQPAPASPYGQDTLSGRVEYYRWWVAEGGGDVRRLTRQLMRCETALMLHPNAEPDWASRVVRDPPTSGRNPGNR